MNEKVKALWVAALRSGKYDQAEKVLRNRAYPNAFCCLGVLCDLHADATGERWTRNSAHFTYLGSDTYLPFAVLKWAGFEFSENHLSHLILMNDSGESFFTIADEIEKEL